MSLLQGMILGLLQGLTEFLPVSSSGHLVVGQQLLAIQIEQPLLFDILVHLATLLAVFVVFWREIAALARYTFIELPGAWARQGWTRGVWNHPQGRLLCAVAVITLITGAVGLPLKDHIEELFDNVKAVGVAWIVTSVWLTLTLLARERIKSPAEMTLLMMLAIGLAQSIALVPGVSRSGATIATALLVGVNRPAAGMISFVAAIPAILGAAVMELGDSGIDPANLPAASVGFIVAGVSGWLALVILLRFVRQGKLWIFAPYCLLAGLWALFH